MSNEQETYELIDRYLTDQMSAEEKTNFEQEIAQDADLRDAVDMHKMLQVTAVSFEMDDLHDQIGTDLDKIRSKGIIKKWLMIGGAGLAVLASILLFLPSDKIQPQKTAEKESVDTNEEVAAEHPIINEADVHIENNHIKTDIHEGIVQTTTEEEFIQEEEVETDTLLSDEVNNKDIDELVVVNETTNEVEVAVSEIADFEKVEEIKITCPSKRVDLKYRLTSQSLDGVEGSIIVQEVLSEGFKEPIQFKIQGIEESYSKMKAFNGLVADDYTIGIIDANGCEALSPVISVTTSSCVKEYLETFSPEYDHEWRLRINEDVDATVVLKNKAGKVILMKNVNGEREFVWDGQDSNGVSINEPGYIWFFVTYTNGETCSGGFNLIR